MNNHRDEITVILKTIENNDMQKYEFTNFVKKKTKILVVIKTIKVIELIL